MDRIDTAFLLLTCCISLLVAPGYILFYGGIAPAKNRGFLLLQNYLSLSFIVLLWAIAGYSLAYSGDFFGLIGNFNWAFLNDVGQEPESTFSPFVPHILLMLHSCAGALAATAILCRAFTRKASFKGWLVFSSLWLLCVYVPISHWTDSPQGWLHQLEILDFAGGLNIHVVAGFSALAGSIALRKRKLQEKGEMSQPNSAVTLIGMILFIFGSLGLQSGSAFHVGGIPAHSMVTTFLGISAGLVIWTILDLRATQRFVPTSAGLGAAAGLAAISSSSGYVTVPAALFIGLFSSGVCYFCVKLFKARTHLDQAWEIFCCHGLGGILGCLLTGIFATRGLNSTLENGLLLGNSNLFWVQLEASVAVAVVSLALTAMITYFLIWLHSRSKH